MVAIECFNVFMLRLLLVSECLFCNTHPIALDIDGKTIHQGFKQAICEAIHGPHLLEAMQIRYDWPDGTLDMID